MAYHQIMTSLMVFSIGLFYGNTVKEDRGKQQWIPLLILSCFAVKVILPYKLKLADDLCYSSLGIAVSYCVAIVMSIPQAQRVKKALLFFGGISFEVYVVNHFLQRMLPLLIPRSLASYIIVLVVGCLLSIMVQEMAKVLLHGKRKGVCRDKRNRETELHRLD